MAARWLAAVALSPGWVGATSLIRAETRIDSEASGWQATRAQWSATWTGSSGKIPVWLWWEHPGIEKVPGFVEACRRSLEFFAPTSAYDIRHVNSSTVRKWLPDWPVECSHLYQQAESDVVRAGLLAKYGGVYLDWDMLITEPLSDVTDMLHHHDFVSYANTGQDCHSGTFSSNFMAAKPGNELHRRWYEMIKVKLKNKCHPGRDEVCCYNASSGLLQKDCHIPWGGLGEVIGHAVLKEVQAERGAAFKVACFDEGQNQGFAPCGGCFWASIGKGKSLTSASCNVTGEDLRCKDGLYRNFFNRKIYHLFNSNIEQAARAADLDTLLNGPWVFSKLLHKISARA